MEIIVKRGEEQFGPLSLDQLREHLASGMVLKDDWVWHDDLSDWVPAQTLVEALPAATSIPKPIDDAATQSVDPHCMPESAFGKKAVVMVATLFMLIGGLATAFLLGAFGGEERGADLGPDLQDADPGSVASKPVGDGAEAGEGGGAVEGEGNGATIGVVEIPPVTPPVVAGSSTSFTAVTQKLDAGGSFYFYLSTAQAQQWVQTVFTEGGNLVKQMGAESPPSEGDPAEALIGGMGAMIAQFAGTGIEVGQAAYTGLGLDSIDGVGASTKDLGEGLKRNVAAVHHDPAKMNGLIWKAFGSAPHELGALKLMPAETAVAAHGDLNLTVILQWVQAMVTDHGTPEMLGELNTILKSPPLLAVNGGYAGEIGIYVTFDPVKTIQVPLGYSLMGEFEGGSDSAVEEAVPVPEGLPQPIRIPESEAVGPSLGVGIPALPSGAGEVQMIEVPEPGMIITMKVKDNSIQKMLEGLISTQMPLQPVDLGGVTISQLPQPLPSLPIPLQPAMFQVGDYLVIASTPALAQKVIAVHTGQSQGIKGTPEFRKISKGLPLKGNQLFYVSDRVSAFSAKMVKESLSAGMEDGLPGSMERMLTKLMTMGSSANLSVIQMQPDGMLMQTHTEGMGYDTMALAGAMTAPVALGAIALGAGSFAEGLIGGMSSFDAEAISELKMNNGKQLALGIFEYESFNGKLPKAASWSDDVLKQVKEEEIFGDPVFLETAAPGERVCVWLYNKHLGGVKLANIKEPEKTVLLYDGGLDWNGSAGEEEFIPDPESKIITVFVDGHVELLGPQDAARIKWTP